VLVNRWWFIVNHYWISLQCPVFLALPSLRGLAPLPVRFGLRPVVLRESVDRGKVRRLVEEVRV
jgi:hypothetical protein